MKTLLPVVLTLVAGTTAFAQANTDDSAHQNAGSKLAMLGTRSATKVANNIDYRAASYVVGAGVGTILSTIWKEGFDVGFGGGASMMRMRELGLLTNSGENVPLTKRTVTTPSFTIEMGYQFNEDWGLRIGYTKFSEAEVSFAQPNIPGLATGIPGPVFSRNGLKYSLQRYAVVPSYTFASGDRFRALAHVGLTFNPTKAQFVSTYYAQFSGRPSGMFSDESAVEKDSYVFNDELWSFLAGVSGEIALAKHFYVSLSAFYSPVKITLPNSTSLAWRSAVPTESAAVVDSITFNLAFIGRF